MWLESTDGLTVKELPEQGTTLCCRDPGESGYLTYPVVAEGVMCRPGLARDAREAALAHAVRSKAAGKGASTVFVSEPQYRELEQTFGDPSPLAVDGKVGQEYCYVAYVTRG